MVAVLERRYPPAWAEQWDRVGLVLGEPTTAVRRVACVVDVVPETVAEALAVGADMIVAHHPLLLRGVSSVAPTTYKGRIVHQLIRADVALYVAHTNADVANPGVSDALAARLGLTGLRPLHPPAPGSPAYGEGRGIGRIGELPHPMTLAELTRHAADVLPPPRGGACRRGPVPCDPHRRGQRRLGRRLPRRRHRRRGGRVPHRRPAPSPGRRAPRRGGPALLDAAHWATERPWLDDLAAYLRATSGVETYVSDLDTDPWSVHAASPPPTGTSAPTDNPTHRPASSSPATPQENHTPAPGATATTRGRTASAQNDPHPAVDDKEPRP